MNPHTEHAGAPGASSSPLLVEALAIADATGTLAAPGAILLDRAARAGPVVLAVGPPDAVRRHEATAAAERLVRPDAVLIPGLVNAHTHLDLTHLGPRPHDPEAGFMAWVETIRTGRRTTEAQIAASVADGVHLLLAGGTVAVGDIAGAVRGRASLAAANALRRSPLVGVAYVEFFALGTGEARGLAGLDAALAEAGDWSDSAVQLGLQPHAPYSVSPAAYRHAIALAARLGLRLCTHLAESPEERAVVQHATGPARDFLARVGIWEDRLQDLFGRGLHPIEHLRPVLEAARWAAIHVNDAPDWAIEALARAGVSVVYCPRASEYFGAASPFGPHRYREMLQAGINVALGTDSIVNLPPEAAYEGRGGISVLDEMRLLRRRDGADPHRLLAMGTTNGAAALGLDPERFRLRRGSRPLGLVAVGVPEGTRPDRALQAALVGKSPAVLLSRANLACQTGFLADSTASA